MKILSIFVVGALALAAVLWGSTEAVAGNCDRTTIHTIQVIPGESGSAELRYNGGPGDSVHVCPGDTVSWVLTGSDRTFFLDFFSGAPFAGATRRGNNSKLEITIDAESGSYNYDVGFEGDPGMDPVIIVD